MIKEEMRNRARQLRKQSTPFEHDFWKHVRAKRFSDYKFRRQQTIGPYIVDFVCQQAKLIVELDGSQHADQVDYDQRRDDWLKSQGYRVIRVWNYEWEKHKNAVLEQIWLELQASPLP